MNRKNASDEKRSRISALLTDEMLEILAKPISKVSAKERDAITNYRRKICEILNCNTDVIPVTLITHQEEMVQIKSCYPGNAKVRISCTKVNGDTFDIITRAEYLQ